MRPLLLLWTALAAQPLSAGLMDRKKEAQSKQSDKQESSAQKTEDDKLIDREVGGNGNAPGGNDADGATDKPIGPADDDYAGKAHGTAAGQALNERASDSSDIAQASSGESSPMMASLKNGAASAMSGAASGASGLAAGAAGAAGMTAGMSAMGGMGGLGMMGGAAALAGVGGIGAAVAGPALIKLASGKVSSSICYSSCNRAACRSDRVRAMCLSKCGDNPDTIRHCEQVGG